MLPCLHPQWHGRVAVGRVTGDYEYHANAPEGTPWHRIPVDWLSYDIAELLTPETITSLGAPRRRTVARIHTPAVRQDIYNAIAHITGEPSVPVAPPTPVRVQRAATRTTESAKIADARKALASAQARHVPANVEQLYRDALQRALAQPQTSES